MLKEYNTLKTEFLDWAKTRWIDTLRIIYHPNDEGYMIAFKSEWDKDPECKNISLILCKSDKVPEDEPILTGKRKVDEYEPDFVWSTEVRPCMTMPEGTTIDDMINRIGDLLENKKV
jgi:hypothetical protein